MVVFSGWRRVILGCAVFALLSAVSAGAAGAALPVFAGDPGHVGPIEFDGSSYVIRNQGNPAHVICVAFVNRGARMSPRVTVNLAMVDATGTVIGVDVIQPKGKFPVGERSAFSGGGMEGDAPSGRNGNCYPVRTPQRTPIGSTIQFQAERGSPISDVVAILLSARKIDYDDSTVWSTDQVPQNGDRVTLPAPLAPGAVAAAGPPRVGASEPPESPIAMNDAFEYVVNGTATYGRYTVNTAPFRMDCVAFTNRDAREAKHVRFAVEVADRAGKTIQLEMLDAFGAFAQGVRVDTSKGGQRVVGTGNCFSVEGRWVADSLVVATPMSGRPVEVGRVHFAPVLVEFADGSTWQRLFVPPALSVSPR